TPRPEYSKFFELNPLEKDIIHYTFGVDYEHSDDFFELHSKYEKLKASYHHSFEAIGALCNDYFAYVYAEFFPKKVVLNEVYKNCFYFPPLDCKLCLPGIIARNEAALIDGLAKKTLPQFGLSSQDAKNFMRLVVQKESRDPIYFDA